MVRDAISQQYLDRSTHRDDGSCLVWTSKGGSSGAKKGHGYDVVVGGRRLSRQELGAVLEPFEGWTFRLSVRDIEAAR